MIIKYNLLLADKLCPVTIDISTKKEIMIMKDYIKRIFAIAVPIMLSNLISQLQMMIDRRGLDAPEVAGQDRRVVRVPVRKEVRVHPEEIHRTDPRDHNGHSGSSSDSQRANICCAALGSSACRVPPRPDARCSALPG